MKQGQDYYTLPNGLLVFTATYLQERGFCCGNGCLHCPYNYMNVPEPKRTLLLKEKEVNEDGKKQ